MPHSYQSTKNALLSGEICLHYQPIHDLTTGELRGYESLARWGDLPPPAIAAIVEEHSLQALWIKRQVAQINHALSILPDELWVSLNIDQSALALHQLPQLLTTPNPARLHIEILESVSLHGDVFIKRLQQIKAAHYLIFADDIGEDAGLSRFLQKGVWAGIKLDKVLVEGLPGDEQLALITESILSLARKLNLSSIAEWVELVEQLEWLRDRGCDMGQGRLFGMPGPLQKKHPRP